MIPYLMKSHTESILDFGCGKGAYISRLMKSYSGAIGVEFYNNNGSQINVSMGNLQIDRLIAYMEKKKNFDVVVCDSVLNSVDSVEAEKSVMACLNLFCKKKLFISGRPLKAILDKLEHSKDKSARKYVSYLDSDNFTGDYRKGNWYFQHFPRQGGYKAATRKQRITDRAHDIHDLRRQLAGRGCQGARIIKTKLH